MKCYKASDLGGRLVSDFCVAPIMDTSFNGVFLMVAGQSCVTGFA